MESEASGEVTWRRKIGEMFESKGQRKFCKSPIRLLQEPLTSHSTLQLFCGYPDALCTYFSASWRPTTRTDSAEFGKRTFSFNSSVT